MGWVELHGNRYRGRHRYRGKLYTTDESYAKEKDAHTALALMIADLVRGDYFDPRAGEIILDDWVDLWMPERTVKRSTLSTDVGRANTLILPKWGRVELGKMWLRDIETSDVETWVEEIGRDRAPKTVRNAHGLLYGIMDAAVTAGKIKKNPCSATRNLPDDDREPIKIMTVAQFSALVAAIPAFWRPLVIFLAGTGCRWGEAVGLRAGDVDMTLSMVRITVDLDEVGGVLEEDTPKTKSSLRTFFAHAHVLDAIGPLHERRAPHEALFLTPRGARIRRSNFRTRVWLPAVEKSAIGMQPRVHDLRHLFASMLITDGVPLSIVSRLLGHASIQTTHNMYFHLLPQVDERVDLALNRLFQIQVVPGPAAPKILGFSGGPAPMVLPC